MRTISFLSVLGLIFLLGATRTQAQSQALYNYGGEQQQQQQPYSEYAQPRGAEDFQEFNSPKVERKPLRETRPLYVGLTFGDPSPSWIGAQFAFQTSWMLQFLASGGYFRWADFTMGSVAAQARLNILPTQLTPFVGGGVAGYFISGYGKFQGMETTTFMLPFINFGLDWIFPSGFRLAAGINFHFPVKLNFPFASAGLSF